LYAGSNFPTYDDLTVMALVLMGPKGAGRQALEKLME
jgi:hypothetical protein